MFEYLKDNEFTITFCECCNRDDVLHIGLKKAKSCTCECSGGGLINLAPLNYLEVIQELPKIDDLTHQASVQIGEMLYIFSGDYSNRTVSSSCYKYNLRTHESTVLSNYPTPGQNVSATTDGRYVYLFGGISGSTATNKCYRYDTLNDSAGYEALTNLPVALSAITSAYYNGKIYLFGGARSSNYNNRVNTIYEYDTQNASSGFTLLNEQLPIAFGLARTTAIRDGIVYLYGGLTSSTTTAGGMFAFDCVNKCMISMNGQDFTFWGYAMWDDGESLVGCAGATTTYYSWPDDTLFSVTDTSRNIFPQEYSPGGQLGDKLIILGDPYSGYNSNIVEVKINKNTTVITLRTGDTIYADCNLLSSAGGIIPANTEYIATGQETIKLAPLANLTSGWVRTA